MKKFLILNVFILITSISLFHSQVPKFMKYSVSDSGASLYIPGEPKWEKSLSEDQSDVYTTEVNFNNVTYGAVVVKFASPLTNVEYVLAGYLKHLNENFFLLTKASDIGKGHSLEKYPDAKGILEYGENANGENYTIKCWGTTKMFAILYIRSTSEVNYNYQEMYFKGFRFP
ncbi:hypothetical protein D1631_06715 [Chryseobacterium nematophagum]|uniref:Uncharacterized protein n=1 Tax=Chryseobacterium nematophagum TaxID=2305228 RepID=A0A3M7TDQ6_9FLAO|nr:hypothetical protein [Chryseobacterium nematophagum]RNA61641.1 hypothetical protein D1631_06715 [Chryseobacterium nematophagum]